MVYMGQGHCLECGYNHENQKEIEKELKENHVLIENLKNDARIMKKELGNIIKQQARLHHNLKDTYWSRFIPYDPFNNEEE